MNNRNRKNRSIFEKKGFYMALYSCIGVVLVLAVGITYNTMGGNNADLANRNRQEAPPGTTVPAPPRGAQDDNWDGGGLRVEEGLVRGLRPDNSEHQNGQPIDVEVAPPAEQARTPAPAPEAPAAPQEAPPAPAPQADAGLIYTPDAVAVMQPLDQGIVGAQGEDRDPDPDSAQPPAEGQEVAVVGWDDDPVAGDAILADPVFSVFTGNEDMGWPVRGEVVMDFSMDRLIHDVTLNQFRTNDKISISATVGTQVLAAADGVVRSVTNDRRLGNTVVIEHGNGWFTTYSQLQDHILVSEGDVVIKNQVVGGVGEPSIFYTLLGSHLSFRVTRDDTPVNPMMVLAN